MPDPVLVTVVAVVALAILVSTWNAAAVPDDRGPLLVLLLVAIPTLAAMGTLGAANAGQLPLIVGAAGVGALLPGSLRLATRVVRARGGDVGVASIATSSPVAAGLRKTA